MSILYSAGFHLGGGGGGEGGWGFPSGFIVIPKDSTASKLKVKWTEK